MRCSPSSFQPERLGFDNSPMAGRRTISPGFWQAQRARETSTVDPHESSKINYQIRLNGLYARAWRLNTQFSWSRTMHYFRRHPILPVSQSVTMLLWQLQHAGTYSQLHFAFHSESRSCSSICYGQSLIAICYKNAARN